MDARSWLGAIRPLGFLVLFIVASRGLPASTRPAAIVLACDPATAARPAAIPGLERCLAAQPGDVEVMTELGAAYEGAGRMDSAEAMYRRVLVVDPENGEVHLRLAGLLQRRGDNAGAAREGAAALSVEPGNPAALGLAQRAEPPQSGMPR